MDVVDEIRKIVAHRREWLEINDAIAALFPSSTGYSRERIHEDHVIHIGDIEWIQKQAESFRWMRELEIAAAPELLAILPFDGEAVLVGRYWACPGETLLEIPWNSSVKLRQSAARRFRRDMEVLFAHDRVHAYAHRGYAHWRVAEHSGTIVMNHWSVLIPRERLDTFENDEFLASIDSLLAQRVGPE